jgi:hypothetical protein
MINESNVYFLEEENFKDLLGFCRELLDGFSYTELKKVEPKVETPGLNVYSAELETCCIFFYFTESAVGGSMTYSTWGEKPKNLDVHISRGVLRLTLTAMLKRYI